jgi:hypothetical protein
MWLKDRWRKLFHRPQSIEALLVEQTQLHVGCMQMQVTRVENQLQKTGIQWTVHLTDPSGSTYAVNVSQQLALQLHNGRTVKVELVLSTQNYLKLV